MSDNKQKSFIIYYDNEIIVCRLSDDEAGKLFKSLFPYAKEQIKPDFENSPALAMAFDVLSMTIDRDSERYAKRCEKNRENIRKRWNKNNTNVYERNKTYTKHTYIDRDIDRDIDRINYQQIADMYNNTCVSFPRLTKLSDARKKAIKARLNTYTVEDFQRLFTMAEESDFLKGKNNRNWSANFDWLVKDSNMAKVLDGNYTEKQQEEPRIPEYDMHYLDETMERIREERGDVFGEDAPFK